MPKKQNKQKKNDPQRRKWVNRGAVNSSTAVPTPHKIPYATLETVIRCFSSVFSGDEYHLKIQENL